MRGTPADSALLNGAGDMCCLGFFGCAIGVSLDDMADKATPGDIADKGWPEWLLGSLAGNSSDGEYLMRVNDSTRVSGDAERERVIADVFAKHGVEVEFVG